MGQRPVLVRQAHRQHALRCQARVEQCNRNRGSEDARGNQRDRDDQGQATDAGAAFAHAALGKVCCCHAGVVHAADGRAHDHGCERLVQGRPGILTPAQCERDPHRRHRSGSCNRQRRGEQRCVVADAGLSGIAAMPV